METLKHLAKEDNKIILLTIHQPRTDILELFDKIILLSMGELIWFGTTNDAIDHFENLGYKLPPKTNPSDFFLDTITIDRRTPELYDSSKARIDIFIAAYKKIEESSLPPVVRIPDNELRKTADWPSTMLGEMAVLIDRNLLDDFRDKATVGAAIGGNVFTALVLCVLFTQVTNDASGIQNRLGCFFFLVINLTFSVVMPSVGKFPVQKRLIKRERAAGSYRAASAYIAKVVSSVPLLSVGVLILTIPTYWAVGFSATAQQFFVFILICYVHALTANNFGLVIGAVVPNAVVGQVCINLDSRSSPPSSSSFLCFFLVY